MQDPTPKVTAPEVTTSEATTPDVRRGSADGASTSKPKTTTSNVEATVETTSTPPLTALDQDQVPDDQVEAGQDTSRNSADGADHRPPVLNSAENPPRSQPAPTDAPRQIDPLDELLTGVESLRVHDATTTDTLHFEVVLTRDLDPNIPIVDRSLLPSNPLSEIPAPYTVIMTRHGIRRAYDNIHYPKAYIAQVLMNETEH
ncbi:hypothetical protein BJ741DRAFT_601132 [Chytriomyces cf. hyalinus JEL632]|nr:hypothetical protein BJ741DRAFT_601132 [Chytriomyces cf. hyalinus JEL632]